MKRKNQKLPEIQDCSNCLHNLNKKSVFCLGYKVKMEIIEVKNCKRWKWIESNSRP